jgi:hypothetical protein
MLLRHKLIASSFLFGVVAFAQSNTVSSGGNTSNASGSVSYSIGQIDYTSQAGTSGDINQGVQQPYEIFAINNVGELDPEISLMVGPNPTMDKLILTCGQSKNTELFYSMFDNNGKEIIGTSKLLDAAEIDLTTYPVGMYQLVVRNNEMSIQSFKIIKH